MSYLKWILSKFLHCVLVIEIIAGSNALLSPQLHHCAAAVCSLVVARVAKGSRFWSDSPMCSRFSQLFGQGYWTSLALIAATVLTHYHFALRWLLICTNTLQLDQGTLLRGIEIRSSAADKGLNRPFDNSFVISIGNFKNYNIKNFVQLWNHKSDFDQ